MNNNKLTQLRLKEVLNYCPDNGVFIWIKSVAACVKIGDIAGCILKCSSGKKYRIIRIDYKIYYAHRLSFLYMSGEFPKEVDHINGDGLDNKWINLRQVSRIENSRNRRLVCTNTSGHVGVSWHKRDNVWISRIKIKGNLIHLGNFKNINDAISARNDADIKYNFHKNHGTIRVL